MKVFALCAFLWWASGVAGFTYWWTNEYDFRSSAAPLAAVVGVIGPFAWVVGAAIHGGNDVLIPSRNPERTP